MAGNDWINGYLEAIVDSGPKFEGSKPASGQGSSSSSSLILRERGGFNPTRYFVEEVISGFDETDLYKSWVRAAAMRSPQERNTRMENMCWRIWNLARKKKQIEGEELQRLARRRVEREKGRRDATADMSDLSEGEKGDTINEMSTHGDSVRSKMPHISSTDALDAWTNLYKEKKLYIVLISLHGLIRGENMELGRDSDTGGQIKYVVELARALGAMPGVYRVDLLTRQISDPGIDWSYGEPTEMLAPSSSEDYSGELGESSGAYIVRIPFGPQNKYIPKESLWPYIQEFVDGALGHIMQMSKVLGEQIGTDDPVWPAAIHGHYADAGDSAALLSGALNVPMVFTGHSLGKDKLEQLLKQGRQSREEINAMYKIMRRIEGEELALDSSEIIITSTRQEIEEQWSLYHGFDVVLQRKLRARIKRGVNCFGRYMPRMFVVPPGMEFNNVGIQVVDVDGDIEGREDNPGSPDPPPIWSEIMRFFSNPQKPQILALARPDPKKNIMTLVKAFGECRPLRELANLTLIMGNRETIDDMSSTSASVLTSVLKLIDKYDMYGQVAYPKHHKQSDVPDIYRLAARTKGVFINPAFIEPFGLTLIEAAAYGLPMVATKNGGPVDIHKVLDNGLLVHPHNQQDISNALLKLVSDKQLWARCHKNGLKNIHLFSWPEHCKRYLSRIASCKSRHPQWRRSDDIIEGSDSDSPGNSLRDIQDISLNLKLSLDGEKTEESGSLDFEENPTDGKSKLESAFLKLSKTVRSTQKIGSNDKNDSNKFPMLRKRKHIFVIALDCDTDKDLIKNIQNIFVAVHKDRSVGSIGFILSTSLTISETHSLIVSSGFAVTDFDAFICNSGSDLYYPSANLDDIVGSPSELPFAVDIDYHSQIEYRWGGEGLRKTFVRWAASIVEKKGESEEQVVTEDEHRSSRYCLSFNVKTPGMVPPIKELRKLMRIQALRCHILHSHDGTKLHVIPVLASRSQALRYLYVRWGTDLKSVVVFVGESGATDYEGLLGGVHKTVVLKGVCDNIPNHLRSARDYPLEDVVVFDRPNIVQTENVSSVDEVRSALSKLNVL